MTIYINKGSDLLSVDESVMTTLDKMGFIDYADRTRDRDVSDTIKNDFKISITRTKKLDKKRFEVGVIKWGLDFLEIQKKNLLAIREECKKHKMYSEEEVDHINEQLEFLDLFIKQIEKETNC